MSNEGKSAWGKHRGEVERRGTGVRVESFRQTTKNSTLRAYKLLLEGCLLAAAVGISVGLHVLRNRLKLDPEFAAALRWGERISWLVLVGGIGVVALHGLVELLERLVMPLGSLCETVALKVHDVWHAIRRGRHRPSEDGESPRDDS